MSRIHHSWYSIVNNIRHTLLPRDRLCLPLRTWDTRCSGIPYISIAHAGYLQLENDIRYNYYAHTYCRTNVVLIMSWSSNGRGISTKCDRNCSGNVSIHGTRPWLDWRQRACSVPSSQDQVFGNPWKGLPSVSSTEGYRYIRSMMLFGLIIFWHEMRLASKPITAGKQNKYNHTVVIVWWPGSPVAGCRPIPASLPKLFQSMKHWWVIFFPKRLAVQLCICYRDIPFFHHSLRNGWGIRIRGEEKVSKGLKCTSGFNSTIVWRQLLG